MSRGRAYTRHQLRRHRVRARVVVRQWGCDDTDPRIVGRAASVHCKLCSSPWCCGNARTVEGETRSERLSRLSEIEQLTD